MLTLNVRRGIATVVLTMLAGIAGCANNPIDTIWYPSPSTWQRGNNEGIELLNRDDTVRRVDARVVQRLNQVFEKLLAVSKVKAQLAIADTDVPNAFEFDRRGQDHIAVSLSFLDALGHDRDALATTIGHELAHVQLGHRAARTKRMRVAQVSAQAVGAVLTAVGMPLGSIAASVGFSGVHAAYSRAEEQEADKLGLVWAVEAGFDPCGAYRTLVALEKAGTGYAAIPFLAMHPDSEVRLDTADAKSVEVARRTCEVRRVAFVP